MFLVPIIFLTILIPSIQSLKPTLKLTFTPDEKYYTSGHTVDISCEIINPTEDMESPQLWHIDLKTGKHTPISRTLISRPPDDSPDIFKQNRNKHFEYLKKNHIRINNLQVEDSARYECHCPDCEEKLGKQTKDLQVMKLAEPKWHIEPAWPIQENAKTTIKCTADDFYPYVSYKIIRQHHDLSDDGKSIIPNSNTYPQNFSWEATVTPPAYWHNTTFICIVTQGNSEQYATKQLEVLFTPRFLKCDERQYVSSTREKATIECLYSGNPKPKLTWLRQTDEKPITSDLGITIETKDESNGKYKSIVTFYREKLVAIPLRTTPQSQVTRYNYYQQLLNGGFIVKLILNNEEKGSRNINIISDNHANQARLHVIDNSTTKTIQNLSTPIFLLAFLIILYMIQHH